MNLIVFVSMSWVKLGDILEGYLGISIYIKKKKKKTNIMQSSMSINYFTKLTEYNPLPCS